ncbi:DMT family transporter [Nonomuraea sp. NPDC050556]|uniref:DMT family transporter n=1 Tax=Nonomuraea sp. NPDC050556 TaxID=3364369 RepID=UPI0037A18BD3
MNVVLLAASLIIGGLLALQASVNLQLTRAVGTPYGASTLQLAIAAAALAIVTWAAGGWGALALVGEAEPWKLLGGLASPIYITSAILLFPRLGALTSVGLFVTGQVTASLVLDLGGLLGVPRSPVSAGVMLGALAVLAGIIMVIRGQRGDAQPGAPAPSARAGWMALGVLAGAVLPVQGAVNAALRADLGDPFATALVSFVVATLAIALATALLLVARRTPRPRVRPLAVMPWWGWLGGIAAANYVTVTFLAMPAIGGAATIALTVTGQQLTSALIDHFGWFRLPRRPVNRARLYGLAALIAGSALVQIA